MTDRERADAFLSTPYAGNVTREMRLEALVDEFTAVRAEERRAVAAFLRGRAFDWRGDERSSEFGADVLDAVARWIERGEHVGGGS